MWCPRFRQAYQDINIDHLGRMIEGKDKHKAGFVICFIET